MVGLYVIPKTASTPGRCREYNDPHLQDSMSRIAVAQTVNPGCTQLLLLVPFSTGAGSVLPLISGLSCSVVEAVEERSW